MRGGGSTNPVAQLTRLSPTAIGTAPAIATTASDVIAATTTTDMAISIDVAPQLLLLLLLL